jgi:hypothetical protein
MAAPGAPAALPAVLTPLGNGPQLPAPWRVEGLPEKFKVPDTAVTVELIDGEPALRVEADKSWGGAAHPGPGVLPAQMQIRFAWRLERGLPQADLSQKATEDLPLKLCFSFDMPTSKLSLGERVKLGIARTLAQQPIHAATLCYVWANGHALEHQQASVYTERVRYLVVDNTGSPLKTWRSHSRNLHQDFLRAFGHEAPGSNPVAVRAVAVGADSDNTQALSLGHVRLPRWDLP